MSLHTLPVAPAPAAAAPPPAKAAARAAGASEGPRFADLVGGLVDEAAAPPADAAPAGPPSAEAPVAPEGDPPPEVEPDVTTAPPVVPWLVLGGPTPEAPAVPAEPAVPHAEASLAAPAAVDAAGSADAVPVAAAPAVPVAGEAPSPAAPSAGVPSTAGPSGQDPAAAPQASGGVSAPTDDGDGRLTANRARTPGPHLREPDVTAEGRPARPPVELDQEAGAAVDHAAAAAGLPQEEGEGTPVAPPTAAVAQGRADASVPAGPGEAVARFLRRERGDAAPGVRPTAAEGPATPAREVVQPPPAAAAPGSPAPAGLDVPPAQAAPAAAGEQPAMEKPRQAARETARAGAESWFGAQPDSLIARGAAPSGEDAAGTGRQPAGGRAAQAAVDALLSQPRPTRATAQAPVGTAMSAPVAEGLEARFQAWLAQAVVSAPAAHAAAPAAADVPGQVIKAMQLQWRDGVGEARVQLRPEHLGAVTVSLRVEHGAVVASVRVESAAALEAIKARQQELQQALEAQGLQVNELEVTLDPDDRRDRPAYRQPEPPRPARRGPAGQRFEVVA